MTDTAAERRDWLQGYEFALRNLSDEAVQADLARVRAESDTHGSDGQSGQPRTVRESGAHKPTDTAAPTACPECGLSAEYCHPPMHPPLDPEVTGIHKDPATGGSRD